MRKILTFAYLVAALLITYGLTEIYSHGFMDLGFYVIIVAMLWTGAIIIPLFMKKLEEDEEFREKVIYFLSRLKLKRRR